jgi:hypothetical protein
MHTQAEELLKQAEKLLRLADEALESAVVGEKVRARKFRTGINDACNALHRAVQA